MDFTFYTQSVLIIIYFISFICLKKTNEWTGSTVEKILFWFFLIDGCLYAIGYIGSMINSIFKGAWYDYILCFLTIAVVIYGFICSRKKSEH